MLRDRSGRKENIMRGRFYLDARTEALESAKSQNSLAYATV